MKRAVSLIALALFATALHAQQGQQLGSRGSIAGVVKDAATGLPLDRVNVTIMGTAFGWTTGSDGKYTIANLPAGIVTLRATRIGYAPLIIADFRVVAGTPSTKDMSLTVQALRLSANSDAETIRGNAAAALYNQRTANEVAQATHIMCSDPLTPKDGPCLLHRPPSDSRAIAASRTTEEAYSPFLFSPELVMKNQNQIGLQEAQRTRIIGEMSQAQAKFTEVQWTLSGEEEKLNRLLQGTSPPERDVIAQMDRILAMEETLKRTQMLLLVRIKNVLTPEQQAALSRLREDR